MGCLCELNNIEKMSFESTCLYKNIMDSIIYTEPKKASLKSFVLISLLEYKNFINFPKKGKYLEAK